jgi:hypothetical protein
MAERKKLHILWTNDNLHTSSLMVMMYATNGMLNSLWDELTVIAWGATVKLLAENEIIQEQLKLAQHVGAHFSACASCARQFGVAEKLQELGIEVKPWVEPFTAIIQNGEAIIFV